MPELSPYRVLRLDHALTSANPRRKKVPIAQRIFTADNRRAWTAAALGAAIFAPLFWLSVAFRLGRLASPAGLEAHHFPVAVIAMYFGGTLVLGPLIAHSAGFLVDRATSSWRRDDAVAAFAGFGAGLGGVAVVSLLPFAPSGLAFAPALWLFGLPLVAAVALTRLLIDDVLASRRWTIAAAAVALLPALIALLWLLGLYIGHGAEPI